MRYVKNNIIKSMYEVRQELPNMSIPDNADLSDWGYIAAQETEPPTVTELQVPYQDGTELDSKGNRVVKWSIRDMFADYTDADGIVVTKAEQEAKYLADKAKALVPKTITPRQARLVLLGAGLLDDIEVLLATDKAMQIWWEYSLEIDRDNAHIATAGTALGLTELQLDEFFIDASKL